MSRFTVVSAAVLAAVAAYPAAAQAPDDEAGAGDIIVTAARSTLPANALPLTIDVISKVSLDQQAAISGSVVDAVATLTPSFSPTRQKLSGAGETLRGRSPLYAINGIPQSTPLRDGARDGFTIDPFFIDRVEVIFGSNALQGIGGTGGIVNQVTVSPPAKEGFSGRTLLQASADNDFHSNGFGWKAAGLLQYRAGDFDASFGGTFEKRGIYYDGQGRRTGGDLTQGETQDSKGWSLFGRFGYQVSDSARLDLILSRFQIKGDGDILPVEGNRIAGIPASTINGAPPGVPATSRTESAALSFTDDELAGGHLVAQIFWNRSRDTYGGEPLFTVAGRPNFIDTFQDPAIAPVGTLFDQSQNRSRKYGGKLSYERTVPGLDALTVTLGTDILFDRTEQRLIATGRSWVPPTDFRSIAPFGQANLQLFDGKMRLAGGARWENVQIKIDDFHTLASTTAVNNNPYGGVAVSGGKPKFDDLLWNGGVIVEPMPGIRAYASYAEGFTVPDVGRITRSINSLGHDIDTFLDIEPIVSNNKEIGIEVKRGPLDVSATYFWSLSTNGQLLVLVGDVYQVQRQRIEIQGLELNLGVRLPIDGLRLGLGYAHLHGRTDGNNDNIVDRDLDGANISPDRVNLSLSYNKGPVSARIQTQYYLSRRFDIPVTASNPIDNNDFGGYHVTDATVRYQTRFGGLTLSAANLFDKFYIDYNSDTQRGSDSKRFYAGRGRTFTLGWDYRF
jgi:iron complex outermembrane receptor protein